ncbi:MAG: response regulator transcription factor [Firmicutes bacterium]|nr:response regulator transcription factor [Bacillota bacterium]
MDKIHLLIASDDMSVRQGLTKIFSLEDTFVVLGSFDIEEVMDKCLSLQPDTVLFDIKDDIGEYMQRVNELKSKCPCSLIIALVENEKDANLAGIMTQGVDGCVSKSIMRGYLVKTVELACRAGIYCLPASIKRTALAHKTENALAFKEYFKKDLPEVYDILTKRELEILQLIARNYSNRRIMEKLYISEPTVKTHVSNILRKLGKKNRTQAAVYAFKIGLIKE